MSWTAVSMLIWVTQAREGRTRERSNSGGRIVLYPTWCCIGLVPPKMVIKYEKANLGKVGLGISRATEKHIDSSNSTSQMKHHLRQG